jgi:HEAT repeat protein
MDIKEFFRRKSPLEKAVKDLMEPFAQSDVRRAAISTLFSMATAESYTEVLKRFNYSANGSIADEAEKLDLVDYCVGAGEDMIGPLKEHIKVEKALAFPIRALSQLVAREELLAVLVDSLTVKAPLDHRTSEAKRALVIAVGDYGNHDQDAVLFPYLDDHSDDVQMQTIEALERLCAPSSCTALAEVCSVDTHAARIQHRAARALMALGVPVKKQYERFMPEVKSEFILGKKGVLVQKSR